MNKLFNGQLLVGIFIGAAVACGGSSGNATAGSATVTEAELAALKAQLRVEVVQIHPAAALRMSETRALAFGQTATPDATTASTPLGTSCGYDAPGQAATQECIVDSQGAQVIVPYPQGGPYKGAYPAYFDNVGCTGNVYVNLGPTTLQSVPSVGSYVFRIDPHNTGALDTGTYYHVSAGTGFVSANPQAVSQFAGGCEPSSFGGAVQMVQVTPGVAGTWTATPTGPLASGTPQ